MADTHELFLALVLRPESNTTKILDEAPIAKEELERAKFSPGTIFEDFQKLEKRNDQALQLSLYTVSVIYA